MGAGWKNVSGGLYHEAKCDCGKGKVFIHVSSHQECDYPPFERGDEYSGKTTCPDDCVDIKNMRQRDLKDYR